MLSQKFDLVSAYLSAIIEKKIKKVGNKWHVPSTDGSKTVEYETKEEAIKHLQKIEGHKTEKGIPGYWYGRQTGIHIHGLTREDKTTKDDGSHCHVFMPEPGDCDDYWYVLVTDEDGSHAHSLPKDVANDTSNDAPHSHEVPLMGGITTKTEADGKHSHIGLQVSTTGFDGSHVHKLTLPDGKVLVSLTGGEMWEKLEGKVPQECLCGLPPTSIMSDLSERAWAILDYMSMEHCKDSKDDKAAEKATIKVLKPHDVRIVGSETKIVKSETEETEENEERIVFGVVLVPDDVDAQEDIYSADEVRKAAYSFLETFGGHFKIMHDGKDLGSKVKLLETYLTKTEETHGDETFPIGTWMMATRILDDDMWDDVKKGVWTGYSIGGSAIKESLD